MSHWILGITGGIGSGKSVVCQLFVKLGIEAIDADQVARWIVAKGKPTLEKIINHFGKEVLSPDGSLNRAALRRIIFNSAKQRFWLEQLLHPLIRNEICNFLANAASPYAILVSPLLLETNQHQLTNRILVIDVPEPVQIARSMQRDNVTEQQIRAIMQAQLSRKERLAKADDIIVNDQSIEYLQQQVTSLHQHYLQLCNS